MRKKYIFLISLFALLVILGINNVKANDFNCNTGITKSCHIWDNKPGEPEPSYDCPDFNHGTAYEREITFTKVTGGSGTGTYDGGFAVCDNGVKKVAFCIETDKAFHNDVTLTVDSNVNNLSGKGLACAISNYIENAADKEEAVNLLTSVNTATYLYSFSSTSLTPKMQIQKLFWEYMDYSNDRTCTSKILYKTSSPSSSNTTEITKNAKITLNDTNLNLSDDGSYYISKEISINSNENYTASLTPGTMGAVLCEDSECTNEINISNPIPKAKNKVYIKIPSNKVNSSSKSVKLEISFKYNKNETVTTTTNYYVTPKVTRYDAGNAAQDLVTYTLTKTEEPVENRVPNVATAKADKTVNIGIASVSIKKVDSENKRKAVEGAVYKLYRKNSKGSYVDAVHIDGSAINSESLITDEKGEISISNLPYGDYKIEEISAPKGYTISSKPLEFKLDGNKTLDFTNTPRKIIFSKQDIAKEGELKGAKICIYNYDDVNNKRGSEIKCYISGQEKGYENKPYEYYLAPGVYSLIEDGAPAGYDKLETEFVFKVNDKYEIELESAKSKNNIQINDNKITIYNQVLEVPEVPDTGKVAKIAYSIIGSVLVLSGGTLIYLVNKKKKVIGQI